MNDLLKQRRWVLSVILAGLMVAALLATCFGFAIAEVAGLSADNVKIDRKPAKPLRDNPDKKGLVSAMSLDAAVADDPGMTITSAAVTQGQGIPGSVGASTLILYDTSGSWGWIGELYAMSMANLVSHFGSWKAQPVSQYQAGQIGQHTATIYIGSTYDEPLPAAFIDDAYNSTKPIIWIRDNIWQMTNRYSADFAIKYGWNWSQYHLGSVDKVVYKGVTLTRDSVNNSAGIMEYSAVDTTKARVLAEAVRSDGTRFPWALRSGTLTYIGENPFVYTSQTDRLLAFTDLLFDALNPSAQERHRALVRIEDVTPNSDPSELKAVADYLYSQNVPFGFGVSPLYKDPLAIENSSPTTIRLKDSTAVADMVRYMQSRGGTLIMHGQTHQYSNVRNPYNAVSGDDFEFYRVIENADHTLTYAGPVAEDSLSWALGRIDASATEFSAANISQAAIFEFPHYAGSAVDYQAVAQRFTTRWDRALYFGGYLTTGTIDHSRVIGQLFPFVVRDVYGSVVLPENIGNYEPEPFYQYPTHTVADILNAADKNKVIRDGFASFYYHPFFGTSALRQTVEGLKARGFQFVDPAQLAGISSPPPGDTEQKPPANITPPTIAGEAREGSTLGASTGEWSGSPTSYAYQWQRSNSTGTTWSNISGATARTYSVKKADVGVRIRIVVTATNRYGSTAATSAPTEVVLSRNAKK